MKKTDYTGRRFGNLVVLYEGEHLRKPSGRKVITWVCQCDCGNITTVRADNLQSGHTVSCGCVCGRVDIIGRRFGRLTVMQKLKGGKHLCKCDCGNQVIVTTGNLNNGNTKSCGCLQKDRASESNFKSLIGQRFGKLTVIERVENNRYGHVCYKCKCDCGGECVVDAANLRGGAQTSSCGCIKSKGEMVVNNWLKKKCINYRTQYAVDDIKLSSGRRPFFDFAIFNNNDELQALIEYQGKQHYGFSGYGWDNEENYLLTVKRDKEKAEACTNRNIPLYCIPYWEKGSINEVMASIMKEVIHG